MARLPRVVIEKMPHHIRHRGNRRCVIFWDDIDRKIYLRMLREQCIKVALRIWAYALMTNHIHLVAVPLTAGSLAVVMKNVHSAYADYFNTRYGYLGHLFGERFKSSVLDERYLWNAIRYVERNPVRAGMVQRAEDYAWSSAACHCGLREDLLLSTDLPLLNQIPDWSLWLSDEPSAEEMKFLRAQTQTGRPCGDDAFVRKIGAQIGRDLIPKKPGPKRREPKKPESQNSLFGRIGD